MTDTTPPSSTFQSLVPLEIILLITDDPILTRWDIASLRLTCKRFRTIIPNETMRHHRLQLLSDTERERWDRCTYDFLQRLQRPGNLYFSNGISLCFKCLKFRPHHRFPMRSFKIEDGDVCEDCLMELLKCSLQPDQKYMFNQKSWRKCERCRICQDAKEIYRHECTADQNFIAIAETNATDGPVRWVCFDCHLTVCRRDVPCTGWPEGGHPGNLEGWYLSREHTYRCDCVYCRDDVVDLLIQEDREIQRLNQMDEGDQQCEEGLAILAEMEREEIRDHARWLDEMDRMRD